MIKVYRYGNDTGFAVSQAPSREINPGGIAWTDIEKPVDQEVGVLGEVFGFHPLAIEDCVSKMQRSKVDDYKDYCFIVAHSLDYDRNTIKLTIQELDIFVGHNYIVTFHWEQIGVLTEVKQRIENNPEIMSHGVDYVLYLILDALIDKCFPILDHIDDKFLQVENKLMREPGKADVNELSRLKRTLVEMRKILSPHRDMINALIRYEGFLITDQNRLFYLDVYDHVMRIFDFLDTYRELISGSLDIYLTVVSNRMNEIMKTLTVIATIVLPLTLISSIYGMNFRYMPELYWRYGYLWAIGLMLATAFGLIYYFRRKKWF